MKPRAALVALSLLVAASSAGYLVLGRRPQSPATRSATAPPALAPAPAPSTLLDPGSLRDVFRFADRPPAALERLPERAASDPGTGGTPPATAAGPRLVGLVRRSGRLLAALAVDGEVELAAAGESVAGVTVLAVSEDGVRIRRADGSESALAY